MHGKGFAVVYPVGKAIERHPLTVSEKLVPAFPSSLHTPCHFQRTVILGGSQCRYRFCT